jgi:hypothetical protein
MAASLADLAIGIAVRIADDPDTSSSALVRAHCLSANAYRLARLPDLAESALSNILEFLNPIPGYEEAYRAHYCRTLALVRWDQGRLDEALGLLRQAEGLFHCANERTEQLACVFLTALLCDEMGDSDGALATMLLLSECWLDPFCRPWLTSRAMLTFTAVAAEQRELALFTLEEGVRFQGYVSDTDEQLRLFALEGRARARLGFCDEAEQMIEGVRRQHLAARKMVDLTLSSLDLLALRVAADQPPGIDELLGDIEGIGYDPMTTVELASAALDRFVSWIGGDEDPWTSQRVAATWYLQTLRLRGLNPAPLPFA